MLDIQVLMTSEDGEKSITLNFQDTPKSEILEIIEVLKDFDFDLDHASEDLYSDDDEIIVISLSDFLEKIFEE